MAFVLTAIPDNFGAGGANIPPGGAGGTPTLRDILREHKDALESLSNDDAGMGASDIAIEDAATLFTATNVEAALAEVMTLAAAGMTVQKKTATIGHADLTGAVAGTPETENIGTATPANTRIIGADMRAYTPFTGGGLTAMAVDIGTAGDIDAIVDGADCFAAAVDGGPATMPAGIRPNKTLAAGGQLIATFTPDGGHSVADATAGSVTIDVLYAVLA